MNPSLKYRAHGGAFPADFVVQSFGYPAGFLYLAAIALAALVFFAVAMPETREVA